ESMGSRSGKLGLPLHCATFAHYVPRSVPSPAAGCSALGRFPLPDTTHRFRFCNRLRACARVLINPSNNYAHLSAIYSQGQRLTVWNFSRLRLDKNTLFLVGR